MLVLYKYIYIYKRLGLTVTRRARAIHPGHVHRVNGCSGETTLLPRTLMPVHREEREDGERAHEGATG